MMKLKSFSSFLWSPGVFTLTAALILGLLCTISVQPSFTALSIVNVLQETISAPTYASVEVKFGVLKVCVLASDGTATCSGNNYIFSTYAETQDGPALLKELPVVLVIPAFALSIVSLVALVPDHLESHLLALLFSFAGFGLSIGAVVCNIKLLNGLQPDKLYPSRTVRTTPKIGPAFILTIIQAVFLFIATITLFAARHSYGAVPIADAKLRSERVAAKKTSNMVFAANYPAWNELRERERQAGPPPYGRDIELGDARVVSDDKDFSSLDQKTRPSFEGPAEHTLRTSSDVPGWAVPNASTSTLVRHTEESGHMGYAR